MRKFLASIISVSIVSCLALYFIGCQKNHLPTGPLDSPPGPTTINGQIMVYTYNGVSATAGLSVNVVCPSGAVLTQVTASSAAFTIFNVKQSGIYKVMFTNQLTNNPYYVAATLSAAHPFANVTLYVGSGTLTITPADSWNGKYPYYSTNLSFLVAYNNPSNLQNDITLIVNPTSIPAGWTVTIATPNLQNGKSTYLYVTNAAGFKGPYNINLIAKAGGATAFTQNLTITSCWSITCQRTYTFTDLRGYYGIACGPYETIFIATVAMSSVNVTPGDSEVINFAITNQTLQNECEFAFLIPNPYSFSISTGSPWAAQLIEGFESNTVEMYLNVSWQFSYGPFSTSGGDTGIGCCNPLVFTSVLQ